MNKNALVWFTGVISKYDVLDTTNYKHSININNELFNRLLSEFDKLVCIICINDAEEKQAYINSIKKFKLDNNLQSMNAELIFFNYLNSDMETVKVIEHLRSIYNISYYIDYSKRRLNNVKHLFTNPIHISMLFN